MLALLAVVAVAGWLVLDRYRAELGHRADEELVSALHNSVEIARSNVTSMPAQDVATFTFQVIGADGRVELAGGALRDRPAMWHRGDPTAPHDVRVDGTPGRLRVVAEPIGDRWLVLGRDDEPIDENVDALRNVLLVVTGPLVLLLGATVWVMIGRALRPVALAAEHEERLLADVSHELRSPIAGLRLLVESAGPAGEGDGGGTRLDVLAQLTRLETLTDGLLDLHRPDRAHREHRPVDLDDLVAAEVARLRPRFAGTFDLTGLLPGQTVGERRGLESVVINLVENAVRHARSTVRVAVEEVGGDVVLTVEDDGPGVPDDQVAHVFDRFVRLDPQRRGTGLGLSITAAVVDAHGGTIRLDRSPTLHGARIEVRLPRSAAPT